MWSLQRSSRPHLASGRQLQRAARGLSQRARRSHAAVHRHNSAVAVSAIGGAPDRGTRFLPEQLSVKRSIGDGGFGEVFEGMLLGPRGEQQRVVLKRVKDNVKGAAQVHEMEHLLNVYASSAARDSVAEFLGYCDVGQARARLTRGLWLVWAYQGANTLSHYLKRGDCLRALGEDMRLREEAVVPTVMQHVFECLEDLHAAGVVHRDVKPANLLLCERSRRFKLIDLGAACDLRSGTNYRPTETINDPCYCPPEEFVLPTDAPHLSRHAAPLALAMSPLLWAQHRPGCFDTYSAGVTLLQLALPTLRKRAALRAFREDLARRGGCLREWRAHAGLAARETQLLDARGGEGWDLAQGLLQPRKVVRDSAGHVKFADVPGAPPRLTAAAALKHPFLKRAAGSSDAAASPLGSLLGAITSSLASLDDDGLTPSTPPPQRGGDGLWGFGGSGGGSGRSGSGGGGSGGGSKGGIQQALQGAASRFLSSSSAAPRQPPARRPDAGRGEDAAPRARAGAGATAALEAVMPGAQERKGGGLEQTATGMVHAGLQLGGLALHVATSLAHAAQKDLKKARARAEEREEALRQASQAYLEALEQVAPAVGAMASYDEVALVVPPSRAYSVLSEGRRRQLLAAFMASARLVGAPGPERLGGQPAEPLSCSSAAAASAQAAEEEVGWSGSRLAAAMEVPEGPVMAAGLGMPGPKGQLSEAGKAWGQEGESWAVLEQESVRPEDLGGSLEAQHLVAGEDGALLNNAQVFRFGEGLPPPPSAARAASSAMAGHKKTGGAGRRSN